MRFYADDVDLFATIGEWFAGGPATGAVVVAFVSEQHAGAFSQEWTAGCAAVRVVDADATLARLVADEGIDALKFDRVVGGIIRDAVGAGKPVLVYGEMVAALWSDGRVSTAIELEHLWNALGSEVRFSLLCAYPTSLVAEPACAESFSQLCDAHDEVVAGAPWLEGYDLTRRFAASPHAPRLARAFATEALGFLGGSELTDEVQIAITELVTNAVVHCRSDVAVGLSRRQGQLLLGVADARPAFRPPLGDERATGGRGLRLVAAVSSEWGHDLLPEGKVVWASLGREREELDA